MHPDPERLPAGFMLAGPSLYLLYLAFGSMPLSRRLANLSLFCGLAVLINPEWAFGMSPVESPNLFRVLGVARITFGIVGILLAIAAFSFRFDGGISFVRPLLGGLTNAALIMLGYAALRLAWLNGPSTPWVYQAPDASFKMTLPGEQWKNLTKLDKGVVGFTRSVPRMQAVVQNVLRNQSETDFVELADSIRSTMEKNVSGRRGGVTFRDGVNSAGSHYRYLWGIDLIEDSKSEFVGWSVTWIPSRKTTVLIFFQALPTDRTGVGLSVVPGKTPELDAMQKSAETICLSVE